MRETQMKRFRNTLKNLDKQLKTARKKIKIYKRANLELTKQIESNSKESRVSELEIEISNKKLIIEKLSQENKHLAILHKTQAKQLQEEELLRLQWPKKLANVNNDIKVYKEKLRRVKQEKARMEKSSLNQVYNLSKISY